MSSDWKSTVRVERSPSIEAALRDLVRVPAPEPAVRVTDLVDLRPAYYRTVAPVAAPAERRARQRSGQRLHARIGAALADATQREVRLRRGSVVGQVDVLSDVPIEVKTTESTLEAADLLDERPGYVEQLAMYCGLADRDAGRLLVVQDLGGQPGAVTAVDVRFRSAGALQRSAEDRARRLRAAWAQGSPRDLPRCAWYARGCEYRAGGVCSCTGDESPEPAPLGDDVVATFVNPAAAADAERRIRASPALPDPSVERFRDLVYPRRAFFEELAPPEARPEPAPRAGPSSYRDLLDRLEADPHGPAERRLPVDGEPLEPVVWWRGRPTLVRTTRAPPPAAPTELLARQTQYVLELGFRAAALRTGDGWLAVVHERAADPSDRFRAYDIRFDPADATRDLFDVRRAAWRSAVRTGVPGDLPTCAAWMVDECPFRDQCGCAAAPGSGPDPRNR